MCVCVVSTCRRCDIWIYLDKYLDLSGQISGFIWTHIWTQRLYLDLSGQISGFIWTQRLYLNLSGHISGFIWTHKDYIWIYLNTYLDTKIISGHISGLSRIDLVNIPEEAVRECTNSCPRFYTEPTSSTIHSLYWRTSIVKRAFKLRHGIFTGSGWTISHI